MNWLASKQCLALSILSPEPTLAKAYFDFLTKQNKVSNANNLKRATAE